MNGFRLLALSFQRSITVNASGTNFDEMEHYFSHRLMKLSPSKLDRISQVVTERRVEIDKEYQELNIKLNDYLQNFQEINASRAGSGTSTHSITLTKPLMSSLIRKRSSVLGRVELCR